MKKVFIQLLILLVSALSLLLFAFISNSKKEIPTLKWKESPIIIDGFPNDWNVPLQFYSSKSAIGYELRNDNENLYICFRIVDELIQMKILSAGMIVGLDTLGKKKQPVYINYPLKSSINSEKNNQRPTIIDFKTNFKLNGNQSFYKGFKSGNGINSIQNKNGIEIKIDWGEYNEMIYELKIPFSTFYTDIDKTSIPSNSLSLNVTIPAIKRSIPDASTGASKSGDGKPSGAGGGGRPSGVANSKQDQSKLFEEQNIRYKFKLATK